MEVAGSARSRRLLTGLVGVLVLGVAACGPATRADAGAAPAASTLGSAPATQSSSGLAGMPPVTDAHNVYAAAGA